MDNPQRIAQLILQQLKGDLNGSEKIELDQWVNQAPANQQLYILLTDSETLQAEITEFYKSNRNIEEKIYEAIATPKVIPLWKKLVAAASIIFVLGLVSYFVFFNKGGKKSDEIVKAESKDVKAPETNRAMITLASGQIVYLDSVANGQLAVQGKVKLVKLANGQIAYQTESGDAATSLGMSYNTLSNPRGSKVIEMQLSDGSHVWLNAGSSITYPVAFVGNERKVEITGEAYFEVTHNSIMPFKVGKGDLSILVLGTHFNVNAYDDEENIKITLLEGSVRVSNDADSRTIKPGEQVMAVSHSPLAIHYSPDLEEIMAWKEGSFHFEDGDLNSILKEFARWYDVEIIYEGPVKKRKFFVMVNRSRTLKSVLGMLQDNDINFRIEGKKLIVK